MSDITVFLGTMTLSVTLALLLLKGTAWLSDTLWPPRRWAPGKEKSHA